MPSSTYKENNCCVLLWNGLRSDMEALTVSHACKRMTKFQDYSINNLSKKSGFLRILTIVKKTFKMLEYSLFKWECIVVLFLCADRNTRCFTAAKDMLWPIYEYSTLQSHTLFFVIFVKYSKHRKSVHIKFSDQFRLCHRMLLFDKGL
jgi:hypothetical protein